MEKFNITKPQLIKLVYAQYPNQKRSDVVRALKDIKEGWWVSDSYISYHHPLKHDEYRFKERVKVE